MNPYTNNLFDDSPATHPRLIDDPQQDNTSSLFGGAAALDPYNPSSITPQLQSSNHERLDDVSTWKLDTIREVATDMYNNPGLALFHHHDQYGSAIPETSPPVCGWDDDVGNDEYDGDDMMGAYGGVDLEHEPLYDDPAGGSHSSLPSGSAGSRQRKQKMHEWPPQSDPKLEMRRKRAVRQWRQRQKEQQEVQQLHNDLENNRRAVAELIPEANRLRQRVQVLEQYAAQQGRSGGLQKNC